MASSERSSELATIQRRSGRTRHPVERLDYAELGEPSLASRTPRRTSSVSSVRDQEDREAETLQGLRREISERAETVKRELMAEWTNLSALARPRGTRRYEEKGAGGMSSPFASASGQEDRSGYVTRARGGVDTIGTVARPLVAPYTSSVSPSFFKPDDAKLRTAARPATRAVAQREQEERFLAAEIDRLSEDIGRLKLEIGTRHKAPVHVRDRPTLTTAATVDSMPLKISVEEAPKLNVLEFDGRPERYPFFQTRVQDARASGRFSDVKIMEHLKSKLVGAAFEAICPLLLTGGDLDDIMRALAKRFGNPRVIVRTTVEKLLSRPKVKANDVNDLSQFALEVEGAVAILSALGYSAEMNSLHALQALVAKLPTHDAELWGRYGRQFQNHGVSVTLKVFRDFLEELVEDRQFSFPTSFVTNTVNSNPKSQGSFGARKTLRSDTASSFVAQTSVPEANNSQVDISRKLSCFYCNNAHYIRNCETFAKLSLSRPDGCGSLTERLVSGACRLITAEKIASGPSVVVSRAVIRSITDCYIPQLQVHRFPWLE